MKQTNLTMRPMSVQAFLESALDEEDGDATNDWREKARQLRLRRWRKISEHGQAVSSAVFSSQPYRRLRDNLQSDRQYSASRGSVI